MEANMRINSRTRRALFAMSSLTLYAVLRVVEKAIDIVNKAANYHDRKLHTQVPASR